jgi:hypothetical protein
MKPDFPHQVPGRPRKRLVTGPTIHGLRPNCGRWASGVRSATALVPGSGTDACCVRGRTRSRRPPLRIARRPWPSERARDRGVHRAVPTEEVLVAPQPVQPISHPHRCRTARIARPRDLRGQRRDPRRNGDGRTTGTSIRACHRSRAAPSNTKITRRVELKSAIHGRHHAVPRSDPAGCEGQRWLRTGPGPESRTR